MPRKPRENGGKPDLLLVGDIHAGNLDPECRTDNYLDTLCRKLDFIKQLQRRAGCPVIMPGDLFDHWKADSVLLNRLLPVWPERVWAVPGQHDLPQHNLELIVKTGFQTLVEAGRVKWLREDSYAHPSDDCAIEVFGYGWGETYEEPQDNGPLTDCLVMVTHVSIWDKPFAPGQKPGEALRFLRKHPAFSLIVTGDNHQKFVVRDGNRILVNAGSLMRSSADQVDHVPAVYEWYRDGRLNEIPVPFDPEAVTRDARDKAVEREARTGAFVQRLEENGEVGIAFEENVDLLLEEEPDKEVRGIVLECTGR